jgi:hypothetical protein
MSCRDVPIRIAMMLAFAVSAAAQQSGLKWTCDPTERHHRFYHSDLVVVCWDGQTYTKDDGGIPQYMLDHFEQNRRNVRQKVDEMNRHIAELKAARAANPAPSRPLTSSANPTPTVAPAEPSATLPLNPEVFASIDVGTTRSAVLEKLGKPSGLITLPGDDGFVEIWAYKLTNGNTSKLHIEKGIVTSRDPMRPEPER